MTPDPVAAVPRIHTRLWETRRDLERVQDLARRLAEALDAEVDLRFGAREDDTFVHRQAGAALLEARTEGLL